MTRRTTLVALALLLGGLATASAEMSREDRKKSLKILEGTLYTRIDVPSQTGRHPFGVYHASLIDVSPAGANTEVNESTNFGWYAADSTDWSVRINEAVVAEGEFDGTTLELALEGTGSSEGRDTSINFIELNSFADFEAAFNHAFSRKPLQDEHPDWPAEIRQAIGQRQLAEGMTKRQAYYVVGHPASVETKTEGDAEVEVWTLRTQGIQVGFWGARASDTGNPRTLRFVGGKLALEGSTQPGSKLKLD